ncbi:P-loop containing nucleoside triphosphate hydrolase protein [Jimgerdemannia flammicorona]|uniref:P-loop containing nucleoside triphosphate hydrolase protein n=2 Tax=Jimgerdemannia flammicorona TaxID=994334 RepID=A0A433BY43_9FUNG|nr:P-loop containing nucleoside triphosphate hydrolase protein [Jimgerdemannia flammicorona]RUS25715.1 P-loop containing nucleoside triphosphate hydrolase protein [Jimgerdemannia flammicorona]
MATDEVAALIRKSIPTADTAIVEYITGYLDDNNPSLNDDDEDAINDFVRPMLLEVSGDEASIHKLCDQLTQLFTSHAEKTASRKTAGLQKLEQPLSMLSQSSISATAHLGRGTVDLQAVSSGRSMVSQVDSAKLAKAEAKIAAKLAKRQAKSNMEVDYEASKLILSEQKSLEEAYKTYNPIMDYTSTKGKVKDIKVENFDISFAGKRILTNANIMLAFGRRYGVVGKNGIGKSTLLRAIARREISVPTHISILYVEQEAKEGYSFAIHGDDTPALEMVLRADVWRYHLLGEEKKLTAQINELEQTMAEELSSEEKDEVEQKKDELNAQLKEIYQKLEEIESDKAESRASAILSGLGFAIDQQKRPTKEFSGGWRMRIALARALFCKPDVLLLDEPDNMLDVRHYYWLGHLLIPAIVWLENYLKTWPNTLLVVSHDREFLDEVATDILHQHSEKLDSYRGNFAQFHATKTERHKAQVREYETQMQFRQHLQDFIDRWRYNAKRAAQAQSKIKVLEKLPVLEAPEEEKETTFRFPDPDALSPPILQMEEVTYGYTAEKIIISGINLDMQMDSRIAIVGPNGAGKSTMLKVLTGAAQPRSGLVHRHGRLRMAYFTQHHVDQLDLTMSAVGFMANKWPGRTDEEYRRHLGSFGITGMVGLQQIKTLSGGQKSRVAFACLGLQNPHILILDEPTNHLDMDSIEALQEALAVFKGGVVIVSHDERFIDTVCNEIWMEPGAEHLELDSSLHLAELSNLSRPASIVVDEHDAQTINPIPSCERKVLEKRLPIATMLLPFSIIGVLVRLGVVQLETFAGSPVFPLVYAQYHPLYIGLTTGLCGSITTFSSWELGMFQALSNFSGENYALWYNVRNKLLSYQILAGLTHNLVTISLSITGLSFGDHLAFVLWPENNAISHPVVLKLIPRGYFDIRLDWKDVVIIVAGALVWGIPIVIAATLETQRRVLLAAVFAPVGEDHNSQGTLLRWHLSRYNTLYPTFPLGTFLANQLGTVVLAVLVLIKTGVTSDYVSCEVIQGLADGFCGECFTAWLDRNRKYMENLLSHSLFSSGHIVPLYFAGCLTTISTFTVEITTLRRRNAYKYAAASIVIGQLPMYLILGTWVWTRGIDQTCPW